LSVTIGTQLGSYLVTALLGRGGMGEVYRARDTKLNRDVAMKVLPDLFAYDAERLARFQREAQVIAALNHPNIVTIYSVEDADGVFFLTMELVEGRSLSEVAPKGGLPLDRLLKIAIPVADAVAAAQQKGITHRDLKPANIMLGEGEHEGRVKVLDFGLAKLADASLTTAGATMMPTAPITGEDRIVGTVAYMSPEQAEGKAIDGRSDLFSLGVILYEMATGQSPFTGETSISILSSIIKDTPKSVTELNPSLPRELGRIIRRALTKDPERRYQTAKDLRNDLEELKASLDSGELSPSGPGLDAAALRRHTRMWQRAALGIAIVSIAAMAFLLRHRPEPAAFHPAAPQVEMVRLTSSGTARLPALAPDGKYVAYVQADNAGDSVWVRQIASNSNVRIVEPTSDLRILGLAVTSDGGFVDVVTREGSKAPALWRVPFLGGAPRKIVDEVWSAPSWSPDGTKMAFLTQNALSTQRSLVVTEADGSRPRVVATRTLPRQYLTLSFSPTSYLRPLWLPDGQSIAVAAGTSAANALQIVGVNVRTGAETVLVSVENYGRVFGMGLALARDGHSFILGKATEQDGPQQLVSVRWPDGAVTKVTNDVAEYAGVSLTGTVAVSARQETRTSLWLTDAAANGSRQIGPDVPAGRTGSGLAWAAGGHVITGAVLAGGTGLWSTDVATGRSQLIAPDGSLPSATGDGRTLVFRRGPELWRIDADGTHAAQISQANGNWPAVMPDGSGLLYISRTSGVQSAWMVDLQGGSPRQFAPVFSSRPAVSPDGRFVMLTSKNEKTGAWQTLIVPVGGGPPVYSLSGDMGQDSFGPIHWTPDGRALAYVDPRSPSNILVRPLDGGAPRPLTHFTDGRLMMDFEWSHDGKQLALWRAIVTSDIVMLKGLP
jgi:serine/threonine protein kinase/Tol biopolymer transport system component